MKSKAFVTILEMLTTVAVILIAFGILFPGFSYQNRWEQGFISLKGRDVVVTMDRVGNLYTNSFNETALKSFLDRTVPTNLTGLIHWSGVDGTLKPVVRVACNCTNAQKDALISWIARLRMNGRNIDFDIATSSLEPIFSASDVLLVWGDRTFTSQQKTNLENYLRSGKGIVEIMDLTGSLDDVQKSIFGLETCSGLFGGPSCGIGGGPPDISFEPTPTRVSNKSYTSYKYYHRIPMIAFAPTPAGFVNVKAGVEPCTSLDITRGTFAVREADYNFWICDEIIELSVYFDTGGNPDEADIKVLQGQTFVIDGQELFLSYIDNNVKIGVSFVPKHDSYEGYEFKNFLQGGIKLYPSNLDKSRVVLSKGNYTGTENPIPAAIVNETVARVAWVADFTENLNQVSDDHKLLLASLLLWTSEKRYISSLGDLRIGHVTSYINVVNQDMYEVYKFDLGLGFPF